MYPNRYGYFLFYRRERLFFLRLYVGSIVIQQDQTTNEWFTHQKILAEIWHLPNLQSERWAHNFFDPKEASKSRIHQSRLSFQQTPVCRKRGREEAQISIQIFFV